MKTKAGMLSLLSLHGGFKFRSCATALCRFQD
jgi:hypothetical protein